MADYMVNVPLVITRDQEGRHVYLYGGAVVPKGLGDGELDRLKDGDFVIAVQESPVEPKVADGKAATGSTARR